MEVWRGDAKFYFTLHAAFRAEERGIDGETLREAVHTGKIERLGKDTVKIVRKTQSGRITLVGKICRDGVKILTVEKGG